jgi:hypothetical protein
MHCWCVEGSRSGTSSFDPGAADTIQDQERSPVALVLPVENEDTWRAKYKLEDMDVKSTIGNVTRCSKQRGLIRKTVSPTFRLHN